MRQVIDGMLPSPELIEEYLPKDQYIQADARPRWQLALTGMEQLAIGWKLA